ncbi:hypothetical protein ACRAWF_35070 [Streptomyces sp. L7]
MVLGHAAEQQHRTVRREAGLQRVHDRVVADRLERGQPDGLVDVVADPPYLGPVVQGLYYARQGGHSEPGRR